MTKDQEIVFSLIKIALGHSPKASFDQDVDWLKVMDLATEQGVLGLCFEAIDKLPMECRPDVDTLMEWLGQVSYMEQTYEQHREVIENLAAFYNHVEVRMMLLKGYGLSKYWPVPNHRPVGDIDVYLFGLWNYADQMIEQKLHIDVDRTHHHHSVFCFQGVTVENHFDFINTKDHKSSSIFETEFKRLATERQAIADGKISNLYYPSADLNALFLLKHNALHFASTELTLRQLLDWLLFVKAEYEHINWEALYKFIREQNLVRFVNALNTIGVKYLGFSADLFPELSKEDKLVERILNDILSPEFNEKENGHLLNAIWVKSRRWWHNRWKHKICFVDSVYSGLVWGIYAKFLKPAHFRL